MKVFISCPFTGLCYDNKYEIKDEYKDFFSNLTKELEDIGCEYYLAIKRENWGLEHKGPQECTVSDYEAVKNSDFLVVIPGNKSSKGISGGVHIELGWASALKKKKHILMEQNFEYSPIVLGLDAISPTIYHTCDGFLNEEMRNLIISIVKKEMLKEE